MHRECDGAASLSSHMISQLAKLLVAKNSNEANKGPTHYQVKKNVSPKQPCCSSDHAIVVILWSGDQTGGVCFRN